MMNVKIFFLLISLSCATVIHAQQRRSSSWGGVSGKIISTKNEKVDFATVYLKNTSYGGVADENGIYELKAPDGEYILTASSTGYESAETKINIVGREIQNVNLILTPKIIEVDDVVVVADMVKNVKESAYNVIAIDAKAFHNNSQDLSSVLSKMTGIKVRKSGGVGSDFRFSLDGFSGKHVKFFIDGIPQDGVGSSFGINNIPINYAERIEVYRGVVPVDFGADALGGVVNIVTGNKKRTFVDASYSFGSFNTHKSHANFGHTTKNGFTFEVGLFQNYSDNSYKVDTPVKNLENGQIDNSKIESVKRFHDTYHNEAITAKIGVVGKRYADRLLFSATLSQSDKEIQTGVRQEIVFGEKRRKDYSIMPSLEYSKRNLFTEGLDITLTANYNHNMTHNIDTATYVFNWNGDKKYNNGKLGEQSYQDAKFENSNWNGTANIRYRIGKRHSFVFNHLLNAFDRKTNSTQGVSDNSTTAASFNKKSRKNISGLSYRIGVPGEWNVSLFGKYYNQSSTGPRNSSTTGSYNYVLYSESSDAFGYGVAGTYFFLKNFQIKLSYEKASRLPTAEELFGDEDLELGSLGIKPESSNNVNLNLSYSRDFKSHFFVLEGGLIYRDTKDYIRRVTNKYSGGLFYASHENHGKVKTMGVNAEIKYGYSNWVMLSMNLTNLKITDNQRYVTGGSQQESSTYKVRIPNTPYLFANGDISFFIHNLFWKNNMLTITYSNNYVHSFPLFWENHGASNKKRVPTQFSHDLGLVYSIKSGRYNIALECMNFTDEKLYDNFSLQKPGRSFIGKFRYFFGK